MGGFSQDSDEMSMDVSVVIPALNEAHKIKSDVEAVIAFFEQAGLWGEIIVVDDGSTDDTSDAARSASVPEKLRLKVLRLEKNRGKGFAVRTGVLASVGDVVLFADSGSCVPFHNALPAIRKIKEGELDVALGSRRHKNTVIHRNRPRRRRLLSWLFHQAAVLVTGLPRWISDSQCGFKLYRGDAARKLFAACKTSGFLFDLEIILRALNAGLRVEEFPVEWTCDLDTRLKPASHAPRVAKEMLSIRRMTGGRSPRCHPSSDSSNQNAAED
jgi:dolichyl-phosphate beta-glucosyltransferase